MFTGWSSYYSVLGEASAALIGLLFVAASLTTSLARSPESSKGAALFLTPTVFKFGAILALSAATLAPGLPAIASRGLVLIVAAAGFVNLALVASGLFRGEGLNPLHWSDPWCYGAVPTLAFLALAGFALAPDPIFAARGIAAAALVLLLFAVRNAWDLVTALAERARPPAREP